MKKFILSLSLIFQFIASNSQISYEPFHDNSTFNNRDITLRPVGATTGAANVSNTGAATYTIPVWCPPGTNGMTPNISLAYNSQGGSGVMGMGWSIAGLSAITRVTRDMYHDGAAAPINYTGNDRFALDGTRLVLKNGTYGQPNSEYALETEDFSHIVSYGTKGNGPESFFVTKKDGTLLQYGNTTESRFLTDDGNHVMMWLLNKIRDVNGNYIEFIYNNNQSNRTIYLQSIKYTGNDHPGYVVQQPYNEIQFSHVVVNEKNRYYEGGYSILNEHILKHIIVKDENGSTVKTYEMMYSNNNTHYYLRDIKESNQTESLNLTSFKYGDPSPFFSESATNVSLPIQTYINGHDNTLLLSGNFNGDGKSDFVSIKFNVSNYSHNAKPKTIKYYKDFTVYNSSGSSNNYVPSYSKTLPQSDYYQILGDESEIKNYTFNARDFDGDGLDDIIMSRLDNVHPLNSLQGTDIYYSRQNGTTFSLSSYPPPSNYQRSLSGGEHTFIGDFDGDGKADYINLFNHNTIQSDSKGFLSSPGTNSINNVISFFEDPFNDNHIPSTWARELVDADNAHVIDFNGDGKDDIMFIKSTQCCIYTFSKNASGVYIAERLLLTNYPTYWHDKLCFGDFNGDKKTDILSKNTSNQWEIAYSNGKAWVNNNIYINFEPACTYNCSGGVHGSKNYVDEIFIADFNGDSKSDILHYIGYCPCRGYKSKIEMRLSQYDNITHWEPVTTWNKILSPYAVTVADANGDGRADLLYREVDGGAISAEQISTTYPKLQLILFKPDGRENLLQKVANGFGDVTSFEYQPLSSAVNYVKGTTASYPLVDVQAPLYTVQRMFQPDGLGGLTQTNYNYTGGIAHIGGRGFLGFKNFITHNQTTKMKSEIVSDMNTTFYAPYVKETNTFYNPSPSTNQQITHTTNTIKFEQGSVPGTFYQQLHGQTEQNLLTGAVTTTTNVYDNNNFGTIVSSTKDINGVETITTATDYVQPGATTIPCMPDLITVTRTRSGQPTSTDKTKFSYDWVGRMYEKFDKYQTSYYIRTTLQYDGFGNVIQSEKYNLLTTSPNPSTLTTTYSYDSKGRFQTSVTNPLNQSSTSTWDPVWGKPLTVTGIDGITTTNTYNGWGKLTSAKLKTSTQGEETITYSDGWGPAGATYYTLVSHPDKPDVKTWYDKFGREIKTQTEHLNGQWTESTKAYDVKGNLLTETRPKLSSEPVFTTTYSHNDPYNRLTSVADNFATTSYTYSFLGNGEVKTSVTNSAGQTKSTIADATGKTIQEEDHGGKLYYSYDSRGNLLTVKHWLSTLITHTYNASGMKTNTYDISTGLTTYNYDAFGRLKSEKDANNHTHTFKYNVLGLLTERTGPEGATYYSYNETGPGASNQLASVTGFNSVNENYLYDDLGRLIHKEKLIDWDVYTTDYTYDQNDNVHSVTYGDGFSLTYDYDNGFLASVNKPAGAVGWPPLPLYQSIFTADQYNGLAQCTQYTLGNSLTTTKDYLHGYLIRTETPGIQDLVMDYDYTTGNLITRADLNKGLQEDFTYDNLNRLTQSEVVGSNNPINITYDGAANGTSRGNIVTKTDVGTLGANLPGMTPNAKNENGVISQSTQDVTYTSFRKTRAIKEIDAAINEEYEQIFTYDASYNRVKTEVWNNSQATLVNTRLYLDDYEVNINPNTGDKTYIHYLAGSDGLFAIAEVQNFYNPNNDNAIYHYTYTDHLGSIAAATDESGSMETEQNFDAWGRERDPSTWDYAGAVKVGTDPNYPWLYRGYTGHEHIPHFSIINMNGRMYDPVLGRMMSPDIYVHGGTQGYNRYSYALNNPLMHVDPDGNFPIAVAAAIAIGAAISAAAYTAGAALADGGLKQNWNFGQFAFNVGMGGIGGAMTFGIGTAFGAVGTYGVMGELGRAATHGAAGYITSGGSLSSAAIGVVSSGFGAATSGIGLLNTAVGGTIFTAAMGAYTAEMTGSEWWMGAAQGTAVHLLNQVSHPQTKALFFSDEAKAYEYMLKNTNGDKPTENFAYVTKEGVYVLPTSGHDINGKSYQNNATGAEWRVLPYKVGANGMSIKVGGKWQSVLASVHTHPKIPMIVSSHSPDDKGWVNTQKTMGIVLGANGQAYGMTPGSTRSVNFAPTSDLLKGNISIIRHYQHLVNYINTYR